MSGTLLLSQYSVKTNGSGLVADFDGYLRAFLKGTINGFDMQAHPVLARLPLAKRGDLMTVPFEDMRQIPRLPSNRYSTSRPGSGSQAVAMPCRQHGGKNAYPRKPCPKVTQESERGGAFVRQAP